MSKLRDKICDFLKIYRTNKDEITVRVQRDFPNCQKYNKCCRIDKPFWDELKQKLKQIEYRKHPFRLKKQNDPPEGFKEF